MNQIMTAQPHNHHLYVSFRSALRLCR